MNEFRISCIYVQFPSLNLDLAELRLFATTEDVHVDSFDVILYFAFACPLNSL